MNWITNLVRPKIRALVHPSEKKDIPDNLWTRCPGCGAMLYGPELHSNLNVCHHCGHHLRMSARERLNLLFDHSQYQIIEVPKAPIDPLKFKDRKRYVERYKDAQVKTKLNDAIIVGHGKIGGNSAVIAAFEFDFMGGSMGMNVGEAIVAAAKLAVAQRAALICIPSSGGARMQEGILSLMQMPRTTIAVELVHEAGLPYIVILTDPTTGGVSASFAMLGDIHIVEPGAQVGFAGARVIEETIRETLPEGFQRAQYLLDHGMVDMITDRRELRGVLSRILSLIAQPVPTASVVSIADRKWR